MRRPKVEEIKQGILPDNKSKNHLGMKNAIDRLKMYYGEDAEFIIESQEGKGTTIVIRIPKSTGEGVRMKIVIVEDEIRIREGLMKLLERIDQNYQVVGES